MALLIFTGGIFRLKELGFCIQFYFKSAYYFLYFLSTNRKKKEQNVGRNILISNQIKVQDCKDYHLDKYIAHVALRYFILTFRKHTFYYLAFIKKNISSFTSNQKIREHIKNTIFHRMKNDLKDHRRSPKDLLAELSYSFQN